MLRNFVVRTWPQAIPYGAPLDGAPLKMTLSREKPKPSLRNIVAPWCYKSAFENFVILQAIEKHKYFYYTGCSQQGMAPRGKQKSYN